MVFPAPSRPNMRILISLFPHNLLNKLEKNPPAAIREPGIHQPRTNIIWFVLEQTHPFWTYRRIQSGTCPMTKNEHKMATAIVTWQSPAVPRGPITHVNWFNHMIANHMLTCSQRSRRSTMKTAVVLGVLVTCLACSEALVKWDPIVHYQLHTFGSGNGACTPKLMQRRRSSAPVRNECKKCWLFVLNLYTFPILLQSASYKSKT